MWYLVEDSPAPAESPPPKYWLGGISSGGRLIGRKNVHIRIKAPSVSRTHATVRVVPAAYYSLSQGEPAHERSTSVVVEDSSAYGTYVKYPPGHASNRASDAEGHHYRLDKNVVTNVHQGALLAFGAPTSWWRVCWLDVICHTSALSERQNDTISSVAKAAGLQVSSDFSADITHFVASRCSMTNMKFLMAIVRGMRVVTPAWAISVQHTVQESCKLITEAPNNSSALAACKLADEMHFIPPFTEADKADYSPDVLDSLFSPATKEKRSFMFRGFRFAFPREEMRAKWKPVLELLGASTQRTNIVQAKTAGDIVDVNVAEAPKRRRSWAQQSLNANNNTVTERCIIAAILSGESSYVIVSPCDGGSHANEDDGNSLTGDGDDVTDVEDEAGNLAKSSCQSGKLDSNGQESGKRPPEERDLGARRKERRGGQLVSERGGNDSGDEVADDDINARAFFEVPPLGSNVVAKRMRDSSGDDVRRFKRRSLPRASKVELKRTRYIDEDERFASHTPERDGSSRQG